MRKTGKLQETKKKNQKSKLKKDAYAKISDRKAPDRDQIITSYTRGRGCTRGLYIGKYPLGGKI
jgi:hypothetical protein